MSGGASRSRSRSHSESECVDRESLLISDLPRALVAGCSSDVLALESLERDVLQNTLTPLAAMQRNESMEKSGLLHYMSAAYYSPQQRVAPSKKMGRKRDVTELAMALLRRWCAPLMELEGELWKNMLLCGGLVCRSLLAALHGREQPGTWPSASDAVSLLPEGTDADVFFYGLTGADVRAKLEALRAALKPDMVTHTRRTVTFYRCVHVGNPDAVSKIQFMLMSSDSIQEVLDNFDVDASGFGVTVAPDGSGSERSAPLAILGTRRALTSLYTRTVQVRVSKSTFRYAHRLNKYQEMGFNIVSSRAHFKILPQSTAAAQGPGCTASRAHVGGAGEVAAEIPAATAASSSRVSKRDGEDSESGYAFSISKAISPDDYDHVRALLGFYNAPRNSYWQASPQIVSRMYVSAAHKMILPCAQLHKIEVKRGTTMPPRDGDTAEAAASSSEVTGPSPAAQSASDSRGNWFYLDVRPVLNRFDDDRLRSIVREVVQKNTLTLSAARAAFTTEELAAAGDTEALAASVMRRVKEYMVCVDHALRDPDKGACRVLGTRRELYGPRGTPESIEHMLRKTRFRMYARPQLRRYVRIVQA